MKRKKVGPVTEIIQHWNYVSRSDSRYIRRLTVDMQYFFYPRQMEISMFQGDHPRSALSRASSVSSSSSSSSSDSSDAEQYTSRRQRKDARRMEKRARRAERRQDKAERRQQKALRRERRREQKMARKEKWQLVVSYKPLTPQPQGAM